MFEFSAQNFKRAVFSDLAREWLTVIPDASKDFVQAEVLKNNVQSSREETDWPRNSQGTESGVKESENENEEEVFSVKSPQMLTKKAMKPALRMY